jgi:formate hydrogenlyase transcriptional activator
VATSVDRLDRGMHTESMDLEAAFRQTVVGENQTVQTAAKIAVNTGERLESHRSEGDPRSQGDFSTGASVRLSAEEPWAITEERIEGPDPISSGMVGRSVALREVLKLVEMVAPGDSTVLLLGETGTGKELVARAIHDRSRRGNQAFVKLNCAAIPTGLLESELFGHERGAFTGAIVRKVGRLEMADRGSLFLDEIGDIPLELQPKLLRALQEQEFERLGSTRTQKVDVRVVAATNRRLEEMIAQKEFRSDLYYRLNVFPISIPPLRERPDDIPLLARHFVQTFARRMNKFIEGISAETMRMLCRYTWPGNIRELQNVIERAVVIHDRGNLSIRNSWLASDLLPSGSGAQPFPKESLESVESPVGDRKAIGAALAESRGRVSGPFGAAAKLGIPPSTLEWRIRALHIDKYQFMPRR